VTIQYLPVGGGLHEAEILIRHRFQTIGFYKILFFKDTFFKDRLLVLKDTFFKGYFF